MENNSTTSFYDSLQEDTKETPSELTTPVETPAAPSADKGNSEPDETPSVDKQDEENIPFNKHPRWLEKQQELEETKAKLAEFEAWKEEVSKKLPKEESKSEVEIDPEWLDLYGTGDPETDALAYEKHMRYEQRRLEKWQESTSERQRAQEEAEAKAIEEAKTYVDSEIEALKKEGNQFDEDEFIAFMTKHEKVLRTEDGKIDFKEGFEHFNALQKPKSTANRTVAAATAPGTSESNSGFKSADDFQGGKRLW